MKQILTIIFILLISSFKIQAQSKDDLIKCDDNIVGIWQFEGYEKNNNSGVPLFDEDETNPFLRLECGNKSSFFAILLDPENGFGCPSYFISHIKNNHITGKITGDCAMEQIGTEIAFDFKYNKSDNSLTITFKGKNYRFIKFVSKK